MQTFAVTLTQEQYAGLVAKSGITALSGTLPETSGVALSYVVTVGPPIVVTFTVDKKPMFVPVSLIESKVTKMLGL
jgi:hypothetical protein